jgi:hypothetical protein
MISEGVAEILKAGKPRGKPGRPVLYKPEAVERLLAALSAGLTYKQACLACGISEATLHNWREQHPDLEPRMEAARETARQKALEGIKTAGEKDWRALAEWLKLTFPGHRQGNQNNINVTAQAGMQLVCDEPTRARLIELNRKLLKGGEYALQEATKPNNTYD